MTKIISSLNRINRIVLAVILLLIIVRIFLPSIIKTGLNWYLGNKIVSYEGHIDDFDLTLYRGAYQVQGLDLWKKGLDKKSALVHADEIDLSLAWRALLRGQLLGDLTIDGLKLNFIDSESRKKKQFGGEEKNWNQVLKKVIPVSIESLKIRHSEVHFVNRDYRVPVDIYADQLSLDATNLRNTDRKDILLPSQASLEGRIQKDAKFKVKGQINLLRDPMAFNMDGEMNQFNLQKLNNFFIVYGPFTFTQGSLSLFSEVATREGMIKGYVKPFFKDVKMIANQERFVSAKHGLFEILLGTANIILKNPGPDATATKLEFEGSLKSPDVNAWGAVLASLKNAFGTPLEPKVEGNINIKSVPKN
jgi:hypothetical protein